MGCRDLILGNSPDTLLYQADQMPQSLQVCFKRSHKPGILGTCPDKKRRSWQSCTFIKTMGEMFHTSVHCLFFACFNF